MCHNCISLFNCSCAYDKTHFGSFQVCVLMTPFNVNESRLETTKTFPLVCVWKLLLYFSVFVVSVLARNDPRECSLKLYKNRDMPFFFKFISVVFLYGYIGLMHSVKRCQESVRVGWSEGLKEVYFRDNVYIVMEKIVITLVSVVLGADSLNESGKESQNVNNGAFWKSQAWADKWLALLPHSSFLCFPTLLWMFSGINHLKTCMYQWLWLPMVSELEAGIGSNRLQSIKDRFTVVM